MKANAARLKIVSAVITTLISGFLVSIPVPANADVCVPTSTTVGSDTVLTFTNVGNCDWTVPSGVLNARVLIVGGGGSASAGISNFYWPAGGGGGEVRTQSSYALTPTEVISISVGAGGAATAAASGATGNNGGASSFGTVTARGGNTNVNSSASNAGAKGGTSGNANAGGNGTANGVSGCATGNCGSGGGGGAGGVGGVSDARNGGSGVNSSISGTTVGYGGGGAGGNGSSGTATHGGAVAYYSGTSPSATGNGTPNTGGGGARTTNGYGGGGGSGVVIVRYSNSSQIPTPECVTGVGAGGIAGASTNQAGHGCVIIKFSYANTTYFETFNYTGTNQVWTSPTGVTSVIFYLVGAGGGAMNAANSGPGASGGFATGTYAISTPTTFTIIVGQGGNGTEHTLDTYGGGGKADYGSGGGRSAIRLENTTEDLITAGGGGGGGYDAKCGGAGGGTTGQDAVIRSANGEHGKGGTQTAGGAGGYSVNAKTGGTGVKYQGGLGRDESGGGGGGYWGGGGGGDNIGAGGGSGYLHPTLITNGGLVQGTCTIPGNSSALQFTIGYNANGSTGGTKPSDAVINAFTSTTLATNSGILARTGYTFSGWNTRVDGGGTNYAVGQTNYFPTGDITLYAQWNSTITYDGNGNTSGSVPGVTTAKGDGANTTLATNSGALGKANYVFDGWNTAANGTGTSYAAGATNFPSPGNTTLYAQWKPVLPANTIPPKITGTYALGSTLTGSDGTWTDATGATTSRQWQSSSDGVNWTDITGAINSTFTVTSSEVLKYLRFKVTKSTEAGTASATNIVTEGTGLIGSTLFANASFSYKNSSNVVSQVTQATTFNWVSCVGGPGNIGVKPGERLIAALNTPQRNLIVNLFNDNVASEFKVNYQDGTSTTYTQSSQTYAVPPPANTQADLKFPVALAQRRGGHVNVPISAPAGKSISGFEILWTTDTWSGCSGIYGFTNASYGFIKGAITYNANGATGTVPTAVELATPASITFSLNSGSGLAKAGLNFAGWNTAADGSGTNYLGGASYTSTGSATLFAIFRPLYTYNANGATGGTIPASTVGPVPGSQCTTDVGFNNCRVFSYTGSDQQFTIPSDIDTSKGVLVEAWGAGGGGSGLYYGDPSGGAGGYSKATLTTPTSGEALKIVVGQGGLIRDQSIKYGGGGPGGEGAQIGSSGGGYSGIFTGTTPLIISGGGGGVSPGSATSGTAGGGGGANQNGGQAGTAGAAGRGGTNSAGGAGATGNTSCPTTGSLSRNGSYLQGGASCNQANSEGGGGGGGGYYGGGGGTYQTAGGGPENGGGGGGSGYLDSTRGTLITAVAGGNGVLSNFSYPDITSVNYANNAGRGGKAYTSTVAENSGGNGLITIQWSSSSVANPVANNTGNLVKYGYSFVGWNTSADGSGTKVPAGSTFPATTSTTLYAEWVPSSAGLTPNFKTNTSTPIAVLKSTSYTVNNEYTGTDNDLILSQYADKIQIIATVPTGTLAITTTTNLTLPIGYQSALNTAASAISFVGNLADVNAALATLKYNVPATAVSTTISISASYAGIYGDYRYNPATGSSYLRDATTATRPTVLNSTTASNNCGITFNGMCGYMTIPNNADESAYIAQKLGFGWIGISKPTHPTLQYVPNAPAGLPTPPFANWSSGEGGISSEPNIAIRFTDGKWADLSTQSENPIYEFGGKSETPIFAALTRTIAIAPAVTITYLANGGTGTVPSPLTSVAGNTIRAAANSGNLAKSGLIFAGWNTKADGTGVTYVPDGAFTTETSISLHAMYLAACTPTRTTSGGYVVLTFTGAGNCLWTTPSGVTSIDLLTVGAGGGGAGNLGGGGGGGQVVYQTGLVPIGTTVVTVGAGGAGGVGNNDVATNNGKTGVRSGLVSSTLNQVALGGSGGKGRLAANNLNSDFSPISSGWTGGGAAYQDNAAQIIPDPGVGGNAFLGGPGSGNGGGGGGGAGGVGIGAGATSNAGAGGPGVANSISGTSTYYGGGGGTPLYGSNANWTGVGGIGGGANATRLSVGSPGTANTGGGGSSGYVTSGGAGGTGIVILRYAFGTPSAPTITAITGSANKLTVTFTPPTSDGGSAITNYEYSLDGGSTWTVLSPVDATSPIEITKLANGTTALTNGTTYQVVIRALNGKTGLASNVFAGTTPLSPPTVLAVAGNGNATITVGPAAGESPTSYTVTALDNSGVALSPLKTCTVTAPATTCVITGLTNDTTYKFSAVANLGSQVSTATTTSTGVTPVAPIVTYDANGGTVGSSNTATITAAFNAGTPVVHPLPVRAGFNFTGWYNAPTGGTLIGQNGSNYEPAATITLTARWAGVTYSISYNGNGNTGGSVPPTGSYINGSGTAYAIVGNTGSLAKTGYTFDSWTDGSGTTKSGNYSTSADLQLFAKWNPVQFTVSYNTAGGGTAPSDQSYTYGTTGLTLNSGSTLAKVGYTFLGWSKTSTGTTVSSPFIPTADTILYARWSGETYSVAFNSNGGSISPAIASFTTGGAGIVLPSSGTKSGYSFDGWSETLNGTVISGAYSPTANVTLYAKWTAVSYNIVYNRGSIGGTAIPNTGQLTTFPTNTTSTISTVVTLDSTIDSATALSGTTYVFTGWKESGTNSVYKGGDSYRMSAADVTFTAQWVAVYTVSYILNGGAGAVPADVTRTDLFSESLTTVIPTRTGFTFAGWKDQTGASVSGSTFIVGATRYLLYAQWTPDVYTITYVPGTSVTGAVTATTGGYKENVTLGSDSTLTYTNYKFVGWKIGSTIYSAGGSYVLTGNVNAEAQWESTLSQIFYDINGGTGTAAPTVAIQNQAIALPTVGTFTRPGYSLAGWIGGGQTTAVTTFTNTTTNSVTLIAKWTLLAPGTPSAPTALAGSGSATVTVNPSTSGGPADSFLITASNGSTCRVDAPATTCVITGLTDGASYTFTSTATNSAGSASASTASNSVTPAGKPSIVTGVSATAGNGNAAVRFTAPATNGGAPIASYTVTASTGQTCIITPTFPDPLGCTVNGLTNGTAVTFAVQANNGAYTSDSSTATIAVTPATISAAPSAVTATSTSPGKATVTFTAPTDNGGSGIVEYVVTSSPGGLTCVTTNPANGCEISGLTNGTPYTFTVVAKNGVGNSPPSLPSTAVTPVGKPSTPTNVVASPGNASATVSFTAPNTGGSAITRYDVEAFDENGVALNPSLTCTLNVPFPTPLACKFDGTLTNGLNYTFKVSATNAIGTSDTSTATVAITPANLIRATADQILTPTGEAMVGELLTASVQFGGFPTPTVTYVWERCTTSAATSCTTISSATADTYTTTSADVGFYIRYKATGTNTGGTAVGTSATTDKITDNPVLSAPTSGLSGTTGTAFSLALTVTGGAEPFTFGISTGTLPAGLTLDSATGTISGTPTTAGSSAITVLVTDAKGKDASTTFTIAIAVAASNVEEPESNCNVFCQAALAKAAADKVAADAAAKAAADKATADAAAKVKADTDATTASTKAAADAVAAAAAAKAAIDKAAAAAVAQVAADTAAKTAAAAAKAAADAQAAANKAAADAAAALKSSTTTAAAKAAATKSANTAAAAATTAVKEAVAAATAAAKAKSTAANASKQVEIAINSLTSKTAAAQSTAQANAIAAAAKAAANAAAKAAADAATTAKANATAAQKAASDAASRIATEQKQAADAAALAKTAADAAVKATADKIAADAVVTKTAQELAKVLADKAALAEQAAKATDENARKEIQKKIDEITTKVDEAKKASDAAITIADAATKVQVTATQTAEAATKEAQTQAAEAVAAKAESVAKTAAAAKAVTAATVAAKVAAAAKAAAAKVPSKAVITTKPSTSTNKNSAKATVTGLKPGQKVKVTVNVKPKP